MFFWFVALQFAPVSPCRAVPSRMLSLSVLRMMCGTVWIGMMCVVGCRFTLDLCISVGGGEGVCACCLGLGGLAGLPRSCHSCLSSSSSSMRV
jgi:hypothetical protein